jgi:hypothetical protein
MAKPQEEGATETDDNMPLVGIFPLRIQHMAAHIGPTLVSLGNARRNTSRRPPRHHTVARNNCNHDSRTVQSNISFPHSADVIDITRTDLLEGCTRGNRGAKQSNPLVLLSLETYTPGGSSCTLVLASHRGPEASDAQDPLVVGATSEMIGSDQCGRYKYCRTMAQNFRGRR